MSIPDASSPMSQGASPDSRAHRTAPLWRRHLNRAEKLVTQGLLEQAILTLRRAIEAGADAFDATLRIAELYRAQEEWTLALQAAEQATALAPERLQGYEAITAISLEMGDYHRAIDASFAMIKLSPRHIPAHNALGAAYIQLGDVDAAMRATNTLIRLDPASAPHHFRKALLCQHKNEVALAVHEFSQTIRLEPEGPHAAAAREALEGLDAFQLNQILTLAMEDLVFRAKLERDAPEAALERGFALSDYGNHILEEIMSQPLPDAPYSNRILRYN